MGKILSLLCMLITCSLHAQHSKRTITINFKINDSSIQGEDIQILYSKLNLCMGTFSTNYKDSYLIKLTGNQAYLEIKDAKSIGYLQFHMNSNNPYNQQIEGCLLVESGDEVKISLNKGKLSFFGKNAEKYNCQVKANLINCAVECPLGLSNYDCIKKQIKGTEDMYSRQLNILDSFKLTLTKTVYNQLKFNYKFRSKYSELVNFHIAWGNFDSLGRHEYSEYFKKYILPTLHDESIDEQLALNSDSYLDFCFAKEMCMICAPGASKKFTSENSFHKFFNNIKSRYKGTLRNRMMVRSFDYCPQDSLRSYLNEALVSVKDPIYLQQLNKIKKHLKGAVAYNFSLPDISGNLVNLSDLKGKVVLMDIWFTGCHWCAVLNKNLNPVYQAFKDNPRVVFLSVSLDKSKEMFVRSVNSGIYTHPGYVNVYTNGQGENHELMKFYRFQGGPHMLLIDKNGKLWKGDDFKISKSDQRAYQEVIDEVNVALNTK